MTQSESQPHLTAEGSKSNLVKVGVGSDQLRAENVGESLSKPGIGSIQKPISTWNATDQYADLLIKMRTRRKRTIAFRFFLVVVVPSLATAAYSTFIAAPRYQSFSELTYQTYKGPTSLASGIVQSVAGTSQTNTVDLGSIMYEYIRSPALADKLDRSLDLRRHYSAKTIDWFSRLQPDASREQFLNYYRSIVQASERIGGYIEIDVQAFDPAYSQSINKAIVVACDQMIDDLTARARGSSVKTAEAELTRQEDRVRKARSALTRFQNAHGDQDPNRAALQIGDIVGTLEGQLVTARAQYANAQFSLNANSPINAQLKLNIASLEQQLKTQQARLAGTSNSPNTFSKILDEYSNLQMEQEFAKNSYMAAQQGLAVARSSAETKQSYMVAFVPPSLPDRPTYDVTIHSTMTVLLSALLVFTLGSLIVGAGRDQIAG